MDKLVKKWNNLPRVDPGVITTFIKANFQDNIRRNVMQNEFKIPHPV